jgi:UDP-2,4-diacetamido-2,4,6-trideoxy-beta-L-altropyranose hydrolase
VSISESIHKPRLYFRVDAGSNVGLGHFIRSSALAKMLSESFYCVLVTYNLPEQLISDKQCAFDEVRILDFPDAKSLLTCIPAKSVIILDGYLFDNAYQTILKAQEHFLVSIDDIQNTHFVSDIVINHGVNIKAENYSCEPYTKLFIGLEYMLLREPFFAEMKVQRTIKHTNNLLVIPGGNDMKNISSSLLEHGINDHFEQVHFISGAGSPTFNNINSLAAKCSNVTVYQNLSSEELINIANSCDICIATASGIAYELSCIGIGLVLCKIVDNQQHIFDFFIDNKLASGCEFTNEADIIELLRLTYLLKNDTLTIKKQVENQKQFFSSSSQKNLLGIFKAIA